MSERRIYFEHPSDPDNTITVAHEGEHVSVVVSEERAVDSYNRNFTCSFELSESQARELRDFLIHYFPS